MLTGRVCLTFFMKHYIQNESFLWHYTLAPSLFQTALSITEQHGTKPRHFRADLFPRSFSECSWALRTMPYSGCILGTCLSLLDDSDNFDIICQLYRHVTPLMLCSVHHRMFFELAYTDLIRFSFVFPYLYLCICVYTWSEALEHDDLWRCCFLFYLLHGSYL